MTMNFGTMIRSVFVALLFLFSATASVVSIPSVSHAQGSETFDQEPLLILTAKGRQLRFNVELAVTNGQRQQGLMYRKTMADDAGMLFDFGNVREVTMWMRNTVLPLDMLFINPDGSIHHIHENAVPYSESIISSRGPIQYVLELNAGTAAKLGISVGDRVTSRRISSTK